MHKKTKTNKKLFLSNFSDIHHIHPLFLYTWLRFQELLKHITFHIFCYFNTILYFVRPIMLISVDNHKWQDHYCLLYILANNKTNFWTAFWSMYLCLHTHRCCPAQWHSPSGSATAWSRCCTGSPTTEMSPDYSRAHWAVCNTHIYNTMTLKYGKDWHREIL